MAITFDELAAIRGANASLVYRDNRDDDRPLFVHHRDYLRSNPERRVTFSHGVIDMANHVSTSFRARLLY